MKMLKKSISWILRKNRVLLHKILYKDYTDNPLALNRSRRASKDIYENLAAEARVSINNEFIDLIENEFGYRANHSFVHALAYTTQITIKSSKPLYLHGYLLYSVVRKYLDDNKWIKNINILETGTARGFSALMMAKALDDANRAGKIITIDILPCTGAIYWNCIHDLEGKRTRTQLLRKWRQLVDKFIVFIQGYSDIVLKQIELPRVHIAFLDGAHDYKTVKSELSYVRGRQDKGDIIVCDDYVKILYPGLVKAVGDVLQQTEYLYKTYQGSEDRIYLYCKRK